MDTTYRLSPSAVLTYLLAGKATLTVLNRKTGIRHTYKVSAPGDSAADRDKAGILFVNVLTGPENTTNYTYAGIVFRDSATFRNTAKSKISENAPSVLGFKWILARAKSSTLHDFPHVEVYHHNHCGKCGRVLTVPESITSGLGPVCARRMAA